ncbi:type II secretion system protein GspM [Alteromonas sp. ASW11-19]|uniref:Type II secretion system protein GspM n=1 Tax=Alteromonas salexigens TaxID=2982530 RepID=A0ABT2VQG8_9ALTE|nr:type II secretion system protein GspM [Alteromonas salexigens]MCU7554698.1 type II secretion system protein GspM [Alteromonas salexigens]
MSQLTNAEKFAAISMREKVMILAAGVVVILLVLVTFFIEPALDELAAVNQQLENEQARQQSLVQQQVAFSEALQQDPNAELERERAELEAQYAKLQQTFTRQLGELVLPHQMPALIEQVFSQADGLQLISMRSLPPVNIFAHRKEMEGVAVYQHGLSLTFSGSYFAVRDFLRSAEQLTSELYWRSMTYTVGSYPDAEVTIDVYTLSTEKAFIGVE